MKQKYSLILDDDFIQYCKLNNIDDIDAFAKETFKKGFDLVKYGKFTLPPIGPIEKYENVKVEFLNSPKNTMVANVVLPVIPTKPPDGTGIIASMDQIEDNPKPKQKNKDLAKSGGKELYDE